MDWQLKSPIRAIAFDCDGTLSAIEGVDELADMNHVGDEVKKMTAKAMGQTGINPTVYKERLDLIKPTQQQLLTLGQTYFERRTPDTLEMIQLFNRLAKEIYIVSAGLSLPVVKFAQLLQVPKKNVFAVELEFDTQGNYLNFDVHSPLVNNQGKREIIKQLPSDLIYVGDGLNDCAVMDIVARFVGFGGTFYRENIAKLCEFYVQSNSMAALLPLVLTKEEVLLLTREEAELYQKGMNAILAGGVAIKSLPAQPLN